MALLNTIVCLFLLAVGTSALQNPIQWTEPIQISRYTQQRTLFSEAGVIPGARSCGGEGKVVKIRHEQCTTGSSTPCVVPANGIGRSEVIFVPASSTRGLGVNTRIFTSDGQVTAFESLFPDLTIEAGKEFVLTAAGGATPELKGKHVTSQVEIFRMVDRQVEVCGEIDSYVL